MEKIKIVFTIVLSIALLICFSVPIFDGIRGVVLYAESVGGYENTSETGRAYWLSPVVKNILCSFAVIINETIVIVLMLRFFKEDKITQYTYSEFKERRAERREARKQKKLAKMKEKAAKQQQKISQMETPE